MSHPVVGGEMDTWIQHWTCDQEVTVQLPCNDPAQVVHKQCASVTKQYNLVPAKAGDLCG